MGGIVDDKPACGSAVSAGRLRVPRILVVVTLFAAMLAATAASVTAQCPGDCNTDGEVTVNEIIVAVNIALGAQAVAACAAFDVDGNGEVTIDDIIRGINAALTQCQATVNGVCLAPGDEGLVRCEPGRRVRVLRCDDLTQCLRVPSARTLIGETVLSVDGQFSVELSAAVMGRPLIFEAVVDEALTTLRVIDFGAIGAGGGAHDLQRFASAAVGTADIVIDPSSEGALLALDSAGLQNVTNPAAAALTDSVRRESALGQAYAGLSNSKAITVGASIAADVLFVAPQDLKLSPDGTELYAISAHDRSIVRLARSSPSGSLRVAQIIGSNAAISQATFERLTDLAFSPDGTNAYLVDNGAFSAGALFVFSREALTGDGDLILANKLPFKVGALAVPRRPVAVVVNPDGKHVFVASLSDHKTSAVTVFDRNPAGDLSIPRTFSVGTIAPDSIEMALAPPDGEHLYVLDRGGGRVESFINGLALDSDGNLSITQTRSISTDVSTYGLTVSPDGRDVYVIENSESSDMIRQFARDGSRGELTVLGLAEGIEGGQTAAIALSPDGANLYGAGLGYNADLDAQQTTLTTYRRRSGTGELSLLQTNGFVARDLAAGEDEALLLDASVVVGNDGAQVYVSSAIDNAIAIYDRSPSSGEVRLRETARIPAEKLPGPPTADECEKATLIQSFPFEDVLDTAAASVAEDDPVLSCSADGRQGHSVWYRFLAPATGVVTLSTIGSSYDTVLAIHTGRCGALDETACSDDERGSAYSRLEVPVRPTTQYFVEAVNFGVRPAGLLLLRGQFGQRLCSPCQVGDDCGGGTCFRCSSSCEPEAPLRCGMRGGASDCEDGTY
jgi:DNA-binding beta-propeller fold protein YncE